MQYELYTSVTPLLAMLVSLFAVPFIISASKLPNLREFFTIAASIIKFGLVLTLVPGAWEGKAATYHIVQLSPGLDLSLRADPMGVFFAVIASGLWIFTSFYSIGYMRGHHEKKQTRYFASFAVCLFATLGIAFAENLFTFIIFYEVLTLATYPLVVHNETEEAKRSGRKYLGYTLTAGMLFLIAIAWVHLTSGNLDFQPGGILSGTTLTSNEIKVLFLLFIAGVGVKAGIMPLHGWLPAAMVAPTPVSALLHAVAVVKSGVFGVFRVVGFVFGPEVMQEHSLNILLMTLAGATIIIASLLALKQDNLKKRLAYSTVGHLSYIVLGAALLTPSGMMGGMFHIATHATMKITMFFVAGAIFVNVHKKNISELDGIGKAMPFTMAAFTVSTLGLSGLPPINGFISKWHLAMGASEGGYLIPLIILVVSGMLNAAYFFPIVHRAFFKDSSEFTGYNEASAFMVVPISITALLSITFGLYPDVFFNFLELAGSVSKSILAGGL